MPIQEGLHCRGYLPHIKVQGAAYFVTFRLADSLPREVVCALKEQRNDAIRRAEADSGREGREAVRQHFAWYAEKVDACLDRAWGASWLKQPRMATLVADALLHFEGQHYGLHAWCVMPNHVHAVVRPLAVRSLDQILHSWKSFTARVANRRLGLTGRPFWQRESYDHWIRDDSDLARCCHYTEENPVTAGLCSQPADWPWSSAGRK